VEAYLNIAALKIPTLQMSRFTVWLKISGGRSRRCMVTVVSFRERRVVVVGPHTREAENYSRDFQAFALKSFIHLNSEAMKRSERGLLGERMHAENLRSYTDQQIP
jgi:hypothetical protein